MCKLKGWLDKGGHYKVEMKGWIQKGGILRCRVDAKSVHYYVQIKRADGQ